ncbi:hypothetical protein Dda_7070 [Drechslerella dactyloides]|uniref:Uncharacterized protein n=1 Tax=Drechslerella dactyloides TaxID=74499 RepID=A0AAD6IT27_DREDA|nr:hypothetical protein Dda_7070 [Drechslerella dactyloides]
MDAAKKTNETNEAVISASGPRDWLQHLEKSKHTANTHTYVASTRICEAGKKKLLLALDREDKSQLQMRWRKRHLKESARAAAMAMSTFKGELPIVPKPKTTATKAISNGLIESSFNAEYYTSRTGDWTHIKVEAVVRIFKVKGNDSDGPAECCEPALFKYRPQLEPKLGGFNSQSELAKSKVYDEFVHMVETQSITSEFRSVLLDMLKSTEKTKWLFEWIAGQVLRNWVRRDTLEWNSSRKTPRLPSETMEETRQDVDHRQGVDSNQTAYNCARRGKNGLGIPDLINSEGGDDQEGKPGSQYDPDAGRCPNFWSTFKKFFDEDFFRNDSTVFREEILDEKFAKLFLQSCESTPNLRFPAPTTLDRLARYGDAYVQHFNASRFEGNPWVSARAAQSILNNAIVCITGREPKRSSAEPDDDDDALDTTSIGSTHSCNYCAPVLTKTSYCDDSVPVIPGNACSTRSHAYDIVGPSGINRLTPTASISLGVYEE